MNWNSGFSATEAEADFMRRVEQANRQREALGLARWSDVAAEAYRGVVIDASARRKAIDEGRMGG